MATAQLETVGFEIPAKYQPLEDLIFCSNRWTNSGFLIEDNGFYPILIGKGDVPKIWLFAKTIDDKVITLIEENTSKVSKVKIYIDSSNKNLLVVSNTGGVFNPLVEIDYSSSLVSVTTLDLRPLGYNVQGDSNSLKVGATVIEKNTFNGVSTMVSLGSQN